MIIKPIEPKSSGIGFESKKDKAVAVNKKELATALVNMDENQIRKLAYTSAYDKNKEKQHNNSMLRAFYAMPIVASLSDGILTKASFGTKVGVTAGTGVAWGFGLLMLAGYNYVKKAVVADSPNLKRFEQNNPITSFIIDLGIFLGVAALGFRGAGKLSQKMIDKHPESFMRLLDKAKNIKNNLDATSFNKKVLPAMNEGINDMETKVPVMLNTGKFLLANSVWILLLGSIIKGASHTNDSKDKIAQNYHNLKQAQLDAAKYLAKTAQKEQEQTPRIIIVEMPKPAKHAHHTKHAEKPHRAETNIEKNEKFETESNEFDDEPISKKSKMRETDEIAAENQEETNN